MKRWMIILSKQISLLLSPETKIVVSLRIEEN